MTRIAIASKALRHQPSNTGFDPQSVLEKFSVVKSLNGLIVVLIRPI